VENAISRYSHLLVTHFPKYQRVVVICEKRANEGPYEIAENVLVVPSYTYDSPAFAFQVGSALRKFGKAANLMVQFEFHIFGGKASIPGIMAVIASQSLAGRNVSIMLHQVVSDINSLSGHLGLSKGGFGSRVFNLSLKLFYGFVGTFCQKVLVHDSLLAKRLEGLVKQDKIVVIPHGSDLPKNVLTRIGQATRRSIGLNDGNVAVLVFGYLSWYKGSDWAVRTLGNIARKYPDLKLKLVLAGGESPTLKETGSYKAFSGKLQNLLKSNCKCTITTGFVPEAKVGNLFSAADLVVFPYRTKMSASGALSIAWQYGKPVLTSEAFDKNFDEADVKEALEQKGITKDDISFKLNQASFEKALLGLLQSQALKKNLGVAGRQIARGRSWDSVALLYLNACLGAYVPSFGISSERGIEAYAANQNTV